VFCYKIKRINVASNKIISIIKYYAYAKLRKEKLKPKSIQKNIE
jgi:hypothetical protein